MKKFIKKCHCPIMNSLSKEVKSLWLVSLSSTENKTVKNTVPILHSIYYVYKLQSNCQSLTYTEFQGIVK